MRRNVEERGTAVHYEFLAESGATATTLGIAELDARARAVAVALAQRARPGARVLLLYPPGEHFVVGFLGSLYAGMVAVPVYPPDPTSLERTMPRLRAVARDSDAAIVLSTRLVEAFATELFAHAPELATLPWLSTEDAMAEDADGWRPPVLDADAVALLQYTSGSTGTPRGVVVTHRNLVANGRSIAGNFGLTGDDVNVSWLPFYHDMGLLGGVLQPLLSGISTILMSPLDFLRRPMRWLETIAARGATASGGPNFAFDLCVNKSTPAERAGLDLSTWRVAFCGAEPVRHRTMTRFAEAFAPSGFDPSALLPCYGLAEATLFVAGAGRGNGVRRLVVDRAALEGGRAQESGDSETGGDSGQVLVSSGQVAIGHDIAIVDQGSGTRVTPGAVGELWVRGPSVAAGYWRDEAATAATFDAHLPDGTGPFLRTGDLGFVLDGQLHITGRLKEMMVVRGRNLYAHDLEETAVLASPRSRPGCGAAFSVDTEDGEQCVLLQEVAAGTPDEELPAVADAIAAAVLADYGVALHDVVLLAARSIAKTSSGKVQRLASRTAYLAGAVEGEKYRRSAVPATEGRLFAALSGAALRALPPGERADAIESELRRYGDVQDGPATVADLNLDSLAAVELAFELEDRLGVVLDAGDLLRPESLRDLATVIASRLTDTEPDSAPGSEPGSETGAAPAPATRTATLGPLSAGQEALLFIRDLEGPDCRQNVSVSVRLAEPVDVGALTDAVRLLGARHPILTSRFGTDGGRRTHRIDGGRPFELAVVPMTGEETVLRARVDDHALAPFDIEHGDVARAALFTGIGAPVLVLAQHHAITDFWSVVTLLDELATIYGAVLAGTTPQLPPATGYEEFVRWQQEYERSARGAADERYWLDLLAGDVHAPALPYREGNAHDTGVEHQRVVVDAAVVAELEQVAAEAGTTLFAVLMVAFEVLMGAHSGESEFLVGATTTGRPQARFRNTAGYFANTVPVRADLGGATTVGDLVRGTGAQLRKSLTHQHFPYGKLVELLRARGNAAAAVNAAVVFERPQGAIASDVTSVVFGAGAASATLRDLTLEPFAVGELATQFDITLHAIPVEHGLLAHLLVRADRFEQGFAGELAAQYLDLLGQLGRLRDAPASALRLAGTTESLARADVPARERPGVTSVHELFESTAALTPDAVALEAAGLEMTYAEVEQAANRLANELRGLGLRPEDTVGLCLRRSPELVIAMLAVMKSGAAFVPLDPALPPARLADMVGDARCARILCHAGTAELAEKLGTAIRVDEDRPGSGERPDLLIGDDNLAYVIFTSGSTGRPKGVQIQHRSLLSYLMSFLDAFDVRPGDRVLQFAPLTFDPCLEEIFSAWIRGATLVLRDESVVASPERFWSWCAERRLTMIDIPTAFFHVLVSALDGEVTVPPTLRTVLIGGEAAHPDKLARWFSAAREHVTLYNRWGTTETTVCSTVALLGPESGQVARARDISIGADMIDAVIHVLDAALRPVPDGVVGEAYIGGVGVGRGYASAPRKTAERFVPDPFASTPGARLYATGDLVRRSADGELRYVGRADQQVKVRGYRIELGEIEVVLRRHPDVVEAAVVASGGPGAAELIAAVTGDLDAETLRDWLQTRLPSYMVPTRLLVLAHIPLTANGKVDSAALRAEARAVVRPAAEMTGTERALAAVWCDVLGVDGVGPDDDFFALGGHSLRAAALNTRVRREFGVQPPLRMFFESVTVRAQASRIDELLAEATDPAVAESAAAVFEPRVSPGQQRLWFLDKLAPGSSAYVVPGVLRLYGALDRDRLRRALDLVVERHPAVRTGFREKNGLPVPEVHSGLAAPFDELDRTAVAPGQRESELTRLAGEYATRAFAVDEPPLMRATLVRFAETEHALLLAFHHIVSDGRSMQVLADDLAALYAGGEPPAPAHDYLAWAHEEHARLESAAGREGLEFWTRHLDGAPPAIDLPVDRPRPALQTFRGDRVPLVLSAEDSALLRDLAREQHATVFMVLAACTASALSRLSGQRRVVVGVPDANRPEDGRYDDVVGFFVNTVPMCFDVPAGDTARTLLDRTRATAVEAMAWKWVPFSAVVEAVGHDRDPSRSPVFQVLLDVHTGALPSPAMSGLRAETAPLYTGTAKTDLTFEVTDDGGALTGWLEYNTDLFTPDTARRIAGLFRETAVAMSRRPDQRITTPGAAATIARWPVTAVTNDAAADKTEVFATRFERVATATPDAVAIESDDRVVTYGELRRQVEHVARVLERQYDVDGGDVVAVSIEPSVDAVVAILAVQRCGAAYLPVDPAYPDERRAFMLADSGARLLVTGDLVAEALRRPPLHDRLPALHPDTPAYLMYTSGSTGRPKGVVLSHRALANLAGAQAECFGIGSSSRMLQFASLSFDASVWEIFPTLAAGGTLCVVGRDHALVGAELADTLAEREITVCLLPPSVLATLPARDLPNLRTLVSGGEACRAEQVDRWQPGRRFVNAYGPTECTVAITAADCEPGRTPSLGAVLPGGTAYVLDEDLHPAVPGAVGELYVGGTGLALGYHRRPALTAERFLPDPFSAVPGARMYRTGDLVRVRADGAIDYLGRADSQLKVRGFRIEPGEIEAVLLARDDVSAAVVTRLDAALVAHVESADAALSPRVLAEACAAVLPAHMVPAAFVVRPELPRLPGGKLDVRGLERPRRGDFADATATALETGTERVVGRVWAELLALDEIGNGDDFFALGGHSLLATSATARVSEELGRDVPLRTLFEVPVLRDYAARCDAAAVRDTANDIAAHTRAAAGPPSVMQERLWILEELDRGADAHAATGRYHLAGALRLTGELDEAALNRAVAALVDRHTTLRTVLADDDGVLTQRVRDHVEVPVTRTALTGATAEERRAEAVGVVAGEANTPMDLTEGPLLRLRLLELDRDDAVLVLTLHHIVGDGWSMEVLKRDLAHFYAQETGQAPETGLPELEVTYDQFARWQRHRLDNGDLDDSIAHWCKQLENLPTLTLPMTRHVAGQPSGLADRVGTVVGDRLRSDIERLASDSGATVFMVLAAALQVTLGRLAGQDDFAIGAPIAGRGRREVSDLIGFFINSVVLRADLTGDPSFAAVLDRVRTATLDAYEHQDVPFETLVGRLAPERDLTTTPLFQVYLNMLNIPPHEVALPGLSVEEFSVPEIGTKFDLSFYVRTEESGLGLDLVYAADRFDEESMDELLAQWVRVLEQAVGDSGRAIGALRLDTPRARAVLPDPAEPLDAAWHGSVVERFESWAEREPRRIAITEPGQDLTYGELSWATAALASVLTRHGVEKGDVVAVYGDRCASLVWAVLAVMRTGAAFAILDPSYPADRIADCLDVARPVAFLQLEGAGTVPLAVEDALRRHDPRCRFELPTKLADVRHLVPQGAEQASAVPVGPTDCAYVAFTSGSTGKPKGIRGGHGSLTHFVPWMVERFGLRDTDRYSMISGISHDPLHREVFTPLVTGACICVPLRFDVETPGRLAQWFRTQQISVSHLTPPMARLFDQLTVAPGTLPWLERVFFLGDTLTSRDVRAVTRMAGSATCVNLYGSTESQRAVGYHVVPTADGTAAEDPGVTYPLGHGMKDVQLLVVNDAGELAGIGEVGELVIRSPHLALGYAGDEALSAARFVRNPLGGNDSEGAEADRAYRTGDLGRYAPDGSVLPVGRADNQVKIRGYRVETDEVAHAVRAAAGVRDAIVVAREDAGGETGLVAYVVAEAGTKVVGTEVKAYVRTRLPEYMVPAFVVPLESIPLTPNRKVDRAALPAPSVVGGAQEDGPQTPVSPTEELVAGVWQDVLGAPRVLPDDNFFNLGGHSLMATQVVSRIRRVFGREIALRTLFEKQTVRQLAEHIDGMAGGASRTEPIAVLPRDGALRSSYGQERLWVLDRLEGDTGAYNSSTVVRLRGPLDRRALSDTLAKLVERHEVLRTRLVMRDGAVCQIVEAAADVTMPLDFVDLSADHGDNAATAEERWQACVAAASAHRFDLGVSPLEKATLIRIGEDDHVFVLTVHHVVADGWGLQVLVRDFALLYQADRDGTASPLPPVEVQYADWSSWQRDRVEGGDFAGQLDFWCDRLRDPAPLLEFPGQRPRPATMSNRGLTVRRVLSSELVDEVRRVGREHNATLFMTLLAAFNTQLHRYGGTRDIAVATPVSTRSVEVEDVVGFFVNTIVFRNRIAGDDTFTELLERVRSTTLEAYANQDVPFDRVVDALQPSRDLSRSPLFQVMFVLHNAPYTEIELGDLKLERLHTEEDTAKFDLSFDLAEERDGLHATLELNADLFDQETGEQLLDHFETLLRGIVAGPATTIAGLELRPDAEVRAQEALSAGPAPELGRSPAAALEDWAHRTPDATAVVDGDTVWTYRELRDLAAGVAGGLAGAVTGAEPAVLVCARRSAAHIAAAIACGEVGATYVPVTPDFPDQRIASVLALLGDAVVVTDAEQADRLGTLAGPDRPRLVLDDVVADPARVLGARRGHDRERAYVIFTSGTTGEPKGVVVEQAGLCNHLELMGHDLALSERDVIAQTAGQSFDISIWQMLVGVTRGAATVVSGDDTSRDPDALLALVRDRRVSVLQLVPGMIRALLDRAGDWTDDRAVAHLRYLIATGEELPPDLCARWLRRFPGIPVVNAYGPAECSDDTHLALLTEPPRTDRALTIGHPVAGVTSHVVDADGARQPFGVPGELAIGGLVVGRGYLGDPRATAARFVPDPFSQVPGARLYLTGDRARLSRDGRLEFLGRFDDQLKIRGFRIEAAEVETALREVDGVTDAVVVRGADDESLVACLAGTERDAATVADALTARLPKYMIPTGYVFLDRLPRTRNGKIDRAALQGDDVVVERVRRRFEPLAGPTESLVAAVFAALLGAPTVGALDNFFELGGHSLLATRLVTELSTQAGVELPLRTVFERATVRGVAEALEEMQLASLTDDERRELEALIDGVTDEEARALLASDHEGDA
ncbi:non-ribosomal peptide synthetase [Actinophytocola algeriensis]|uniref:Amino acid adenylation domain-containing protein n=1 Tax=Actinophytocola algeriensis TaxID=1768010 RepID=A0A7W7QDQ8_9PSEU|nr:non-ribosomal peptide synthetase [Actinophytocola algeriensis]MBB4911643.1 amino acid adenylation domain-containing protein [Actinophytocola algeriensis]MBE1473369.1 amino acid adenylation domain-containing protein [Actinophytocola algeriensis]